MAKAIRLMVLFGDTHCGSTWGMCPTGVTSVEGNEFRPNKLQAWLNEQWADAHGEWVPSIVGKDPYAVCHTGDAMEGVHHGTKEIISPDEEDHLELAAALLKPVADRADATYLVEGTECHTKNKESSLGKQIGAVRYPYVTQRKNSWPRLDIEIAGARVIVQHHITTSIRNWTQATGLNTALSQEQLRAVANKEAPPRVLVSAHRHQFGIFESMSGVSLVTHAWQGLTRHGRKVVPSDMDRPNPGIVILDWRNRDDGAPPEVHVRSYRSTERKVIRL